MAIEKDARFDVLLVDTPDGAQVNEALGLVLEERSGALGFATQLISPYAGQLAQGDLQDKDLTRGTVQTQRSWRKGRGQTNLLEDPFKFSDAYADTRFDGQLILPPEARTSSISGSNDPGYSGSATTGTKRAQASWGTGSRVNVTRQASVSWGVGTRNNSTRAASVSWGAGTRNPISDPISAVWSQATIDNPTHSNTMGTDPTSIYYVSFVPKQTFTLTSVQIWLSPTSAQQVYIKPDNGGVPNHAAAPLAYVNGGATNNTANYMWTNGALNTSIVCTAGVRYWIATINGYILGYDGTLNGVYWDGAVLRSALRYSFLLNGGLVQDDQKTLTRRAQSFVVGSSSVSVTQVQVPLSSSVWEAAPTGAVSIYSDSGGSPGTLIATASLSNPTLMSWKVFSISTTLSANTTYWIVVEVDASNSSNEATVSWLKDGNSNYSGGSAKVQTYSNGSWGVWSVLGGDFYFIINTLQSGAPYFYTLDETRTIRGQLFTPASNVTVTQVQVLISRSTWVGSPDVRLKVYSQTGSSPGTLLATSAAIGDPGASAAWVTVSLSVSLTAGTPYYLVLDVNSTSDSTSASVNWQCDLSNNYGSARYSVVVNDGTATWTLENISFYFIVNTLQSGAPYFYTSDETRTLRAQRFVTVGAVTVTQVQVPISRSTWVGSPDVRLRFYADSGGNPGTLIASSGAISDPGTGIVWVTVAIAASLAAGTTYFLVLDVNSTSDGNSVVIDWQGDGTSSFGYSARTATALNDGTATWVTDATLSFYFVINSVASGNPFFYTHDRTRIRLSQSFVPSGAVTMTFLRFFAQLIQWSAGGTATIGIYANSGGDPGAAIVTASLSQAAFTNAGAVAQANWVAVSMSTALVAGTTYHMVLECDAPAIGDVVLIDWRTDPAAGYAGVAKQASSTSTFVWGAWATQSVDFWFSINNGTQLPSAVTVNPVRFNNQLYVSSGASIYRYNTGTVTWELVNTAAVTVTALVAFAGALYAALGDSNDMIYSTTGSSGQWANTISSRRYTWLRAYNGYLWGAKASGGASAVGVSATPTTLTSWEDLTAATSDVVLTGLVGFQDSVMVLSTRGLYGISTRYVYQVHDWSVDEVADNGKNAIVWVADGRLHIPLRSGLNAYDGVRMVPVGPDLGEGLPVGEQGRIAAMVGTRTWLFAAIDAGTSGRSAIYAYNGEGWHCLIKAANVGKRIRAIFLESITSSVGFARLWWFEDSLPHYVEFPDSTDNPRKISGIRFASQGQLTGTRVGGELAQIKKELHNVIVTTEDCSSGQIVDVYVDSDGSDNWLKIGTINQNGSTRIELYAPTLIPKATGSGCTATVINITGSSTSDMSPGQFVRIGTQYGQVKTVNSATQFSLMYPLDNAPSVGQKVYGSVPVGVDFRYRLVLATDDATKTPVVRRVSMKWREQMINKSRMFTLTVPVDDGLVYRTAGDAEISAAAYSAMIDQWCERLTAFVLVDPRGVNYWVKVTSAQESEWVRVQRADMSPAALRTRKVVQLEQVR